MPGACEARTWRGRCTWWQRRDVISLALSQCSPIRLSPQRLLDADVDLAVVTAGVDAAGELVLDERTEPFREQLVLLGFTGAWSQSKLLARATGPALLVVGTGPVLAAAGVTLREPRHA